jgi:hypothetical protein
MLTQKIYDTEIYETKNNICLKIYNKKQLLSIKIFESVIIYIYSHGAKLVLIKRKIGLLLIFGLE